MGERWRMSEGIQLSILVLTEGIVQEAVCDRSLSVHCHLHLTHCVKTYLTSIRTSRRALTRNYFAVAASTLVKTYLSKESRNGLGKWHAVANDVGMDGLTSMGGRCGGDDLSWLEGVVGDFSAGTRTTDMEGRSTTLPNEIHQLMDTAPGSTNDNTLVNIHYVIGSSNPVFPSSEVLLARALLLLASTHSANVELVLPDGVPCDQLWAEPLNDWVNIVGVANVWSASQWQPAWDMLWRGCVSLPPMQESSSIREDSASSSQVDSPSTLQNSTTPPSFSGFSLSLSPDTADSAFTSSVLEGIGLNPPATAGSSHARPHPNGYKPSHIELMHVVDHSTVPVEVKSPIHCKLTLSNASPRPSKKMFQSLLCSSGLETQNLAYLVRLILSPSSDQEADGVEIRKTDRWFSSVTKAQENCLKDSVHRSDSFVAGPVLLLWPTCDTSLSGTLARDHGGGMAWSCDAQFLRQLNSINNVPQSVSCTREVVEDMEMNEAAIAQFAIDETSQFSMISSRSTPNEDSNGSPQESTSSPKKKKKKKKEKTARLKDVLGLAVVAALKKNGLSRSMPIFKPCYVKLFNLAKLFLKDVQLPSNPSNLEMEIQRVVKLNAKNVITYHLEQSQNNQCRKKTSKSNNKIKQQGTN